MHLRDLCAPAPLPTNQKTGWRLPKQTCLPARQALLKMMRWTENEHRINWKKNWLVMKLTAIFLLTACLQVSAKGFTQNVTLSEKNAPLQKIFKQIHKQTGYQFFYEDELLNKAGKVDIRVKDAPLEKVLAMCFKDLQLTYAIVNKAITVQSKKQDHFVELPPPAFMEISGKVTDENGNPLIVA